MFWFKNRNRQLVEAQLEKLVLEIRSRREETYVDGRGEIVAANGKPAQYSFRWR